MRHSLSAALPLSFECRTPEASRAQSLVWNSSPGAALSSHPFRQPGSHRPPQGPILPLVILRPLSAFVKRIIRHILKYRSFRAQESLSNRTAPHCLSFELPHIQKGRRPASPPFGIKLTVSASLSFDLACSRKSGPLNCRRASRSPAGNTSNRQPQPSLHRTSAQPALKVLIAKFLHHLPRAVLMAQGDGGQGHAVEGVCLDHGIQRHIF